MWIATWSARRRSICRFRSPTASIRSKCTKLGFAPYIDVFTAKPGTPVKLEVELVPISGVLHVTSSLKEVRVLIDGRYVGDAPVDVEMDAGPRAVQVSKRCYEEVFKNVMAVAGQTIAISGDLAELSADTNPCIVKTLAPLKWYQKKWVWAVIGVSALAAAGAAVGAFYGTRNTDPLSGADVCYSIQGLRLRYSLRRYFPPQLEGSLAAATTLGSLSPRAVARAWRARSPQ